MFFFFWGGEGGSGRGWGLGGQGGWDERSEAFVRIQKKKIFFWGGGSRVGPSGGGGLWGCHVDVNGEVKFL